MLAFVPIWVSLETSHRDLKLSHAGCVGTRDKYMKQLEIQDRATRQVFKISPTANTEVVTTRDGVKVRLHPIAIRTFVRKGEVFSGQTLIGDREMVRL